MNGPDDTDPLLETLRLAQRLGFFGAAPMEQARAHAAAFVEAISDVSPGTRIADIGSGGGLPGLVVAAAFPGAQVTLIDRRQKRTDFLERAVQRLGLANTAVWCRDVSAVARGVAAGVVAPFEIVTARGFGPPATTLRLGTELLGPAGGRVVISEPPAGDRWPSELLTELGLSISPPAPIRVFTRCATP